MPNGMTVQRYLPNGVLKHVILLELSSSGTYKKPSFVSNKENTFAFPNLLTISSTHGSG